MTKFIFASLVATVFWMTAARADIVSTTLDCASTNDSYVECDAGTSFTNAKLVSENVDGSCVYGSTWGTYDHYVWVNHGCVGRFEVTNDQPGANNPPPPPQGRHDIDDLDCRWNSVNWQPWYRPAGHYIGRPGFGFQTQNDCENDIQMVRRHAVCNWTGSGFTPYDIESNVEILLVSYPTVDACYSSL